MTWVSGFLSAADFAPSGIGDAGALAVMEAAAAGAAAVAAAAGLSVAAGLAVAVDACVSAGLATVVLAAAALVVFRDVVFFAGADFGRPGRAAVLALALAEDFAVDFLV